jgi:hypothetical protein
MSMRWLERLLLFAGYQAATAQWSKEMKIYLLVMLIGALLTAIHFTSVPDQNSETLPQ